MRNIKVDIYDEEARSISYFLHCQNPLCIASLDLEIENFETNTIRRLQEYLDLQYDYNVALVCVPVHIPSRRRIFGSVPHFSTLNQQAGEGHDVAAFIDKSRVESPIYIEPLVIFDELIRKQTYGKGNSNS